MINKVLTAKQFEKVIASALGKSELPELDELLLQLRHRAGLPAKEMAELTIKSVTDGNGGIARTIRTGGGVSGLLARDVPVHPDLERSAAAYIKAKPISSGSLFVTHNGGPYPPGKLSQRIRRLYLLAGFPDLPPDIGRCCFARSLIEGLNGVPYSLRDVQRLMGFRHLSAVTRFVLPGECVVKLLDQVCSDLECSSISASTPDLSRSPLDTALTLADSAEPYFPASEMRAASLLERERKLSVIR